MLNFNSIPDGNCLYNSEAVLLALSYQQGKLQALFENPRFAQTAKKLFIELKMISKKAQLQSKEEINACFAQLIADYQNADGHLEWYDLQKDLAEALRKLVAKALRTDPEIKQIAKYLFNNLFISTHDNGDIILSHEFEEYTGVIKQIEKINRIRLSPEQKRKRLENWFFRHDEKGLKSLISRLEKDGVYAGPLEISVLSYLFDGIPHVIYTRNNTRDNCPMVFRALHFNETGDLVEQPNQHSVSADELAFNLRLTGQGKGAHYSVDLPDTQANRNLIRTYEQQQEDTVSPSETTMIASPEAKKDHTALIIYTLTFLTATVWCHFLLAPMLTAQLTLLAGPYFASFASLLFSGFFGLSCGLGVMKGYEALKQAEEADLTPPNIENIESRSHHPNTQEYSLEPGPAALLTQFHAQQHGSSSNERTSIAVTDEAQARESAPESRFSPV